jgi:hypothetical protein
MRLSQHVFGPAGSHQVILEGLLFSLRCPLVAPSARRGRGGNLPCDHAVVVALACLFVLLRITSYVELTPRGLDLHARLGIVTVPWLYIGW